MTTIKLFKRKGSEPDQESVQAVQISYRNIGDDGEVEAMVGGDVGNAQDGSLIVATRQGPLKLEIGSWIVNVAKDEFVVLGEEAFRALYEQTTW